VETPALFVSNAPMSETWKRAALYGLALAAGTAGLQWLDYQRLMRAHDGDAIIGLIAFAFLTLGVFVGARLFAGRTVPVGEGNPQAQAALGISARELEVLQELAAGRSNKEIAQRLEVSPNTVKTHVARLFEKLGARRRTEALAKARELDLIG
jgi:DNA-binding CsgD family transcriptional regulator